MNGSEWSVGLHANLTQGEPVSGSDGLSAILNHEGRFAGRRTLMRACFLGQVKVETLEREIQAQWDLCDSSGVRLAHIDSHQHAHLIPMVRVAIQCVADRGKVPVRRLSLKTVGEGGLRAMKSRALNHLARRGEKKSGARALVDCELISIFQTDGLPSAAIYKSLLSQSQSNFIELMVHPAIVESEHQALTDISVVSQADYDTLRSDDWRDVMKSSEFKFMSTAEMIRRAESC